MSVGSLTGFIKCSHRSLVEIRVKTFWRREGISKTCSGVSCMFLFCFFILFCFLYFFLPSNLLSFFSSFLAYVFGDFITLLFRILFYSCLIYPLFCLTASPCFVSDFSSPFSRFFLWSFFKVGTYHTSTDLSTKRPAFCPHRVFRVFRIIPAKRAAHFPAQH